MSVEGMLQSEGEFLEFQRAAGLYHGHILFEVRCLHMLFERSLVGPGFANHEHIWTGGAFKSVVCHASGILPRGSRQRHGSFESLGVAALGSLEKAVESKHFLLVF